MFATLRRALVCAVLVSAVSTPALAEYGRTPGSFSVSGGAGSRESPLCRWAYFRLCRPSMAFVMEVRTLDPTLG